MLFCNTITLSGVLLMIYLIIALIALGVGYLIISRIAEQLFKADDTVITPVMRMNDGVDYVEMPKWKMFLIQLLNIAGLGPIFGAIAGALFGPVAFLWIVFGGLLIGGFHDYFSAMVSLRHNGVTFAELTGIYLGRTPLYLTRIFSLILLTLLGVVFVKGPAGLLANLMINSPYEMIRSINFWIVIVFIYVAFATLFPVDKILGKLSPIFSVVFIAMPLGLLAMLLFGGKSQNMPAFTLENLHYNATTTPIWPFLFVTIACGAVSGFHSTQSPLMARCLKKESDGRGVFYGAMITESVIALIWAAAAMSYFDNMGGFNQVMKENGNNAAIIVNMITSTWFGRAGAILAIIGVAAAPITSAGTAFRVARLSLADMLKKNQTKLGNRLLLALPLFGAAFLLLQVDFGIIWRYFAFSNQLLAAITLWTVAMYQATKGGNHWILSLGATFMSAVVSSYILFAPEGFRLPFNIAITISIVFAFSLLGLFLKKVSTLKS
jgi:carbon starvation protein CstA